MSSNLEKLIGLMDKLVAEHKVGEDDGVYFQSTGSGYDEELENLLGEIEEIACTELIGPKAQPNYENMDKLKKMSNGRYRVIKGESDSFGWLTGVIVAKEGRVVYG